MKAFLTVAESWEPIAWHWPTPPGFLRIYDKYADKETTLAIDASCWDLLVQGRVAHFEFLLGAKGQLQRTLVALAKSGRSPSTVDKFCRSLLNNWTIYYNILSDGPSNLKRHWESSVLDIDTAKAGKDVLKLACMSSVGPWQPCHLPFVKGLDTRANSTVRAQRSKHVRRGALISVEAQAGIVRVLDVAANQQGLADTEIEALTALALIYQHGVRPVQVIALRVEHVLLLTDAAKSATCIVSFHGAKRKDGKIIEIARQMKPEWISLMQRSLALATQAGRRKVIGMTTAHSVWAEVKRACAKIGVKIGFTAGKLRHTSAQLLADGGQSRQSIREFLGHKNDNAASVYVTASRKQAELINSALGASKLYTNILSLADAVFVSADDMLRASEDQQVGAIVGLRLVAGVGLCGTGQPNCPYNPVTSCYGCRKFMPSLDRKAHEDAGAGMREQVLAFVDRGGSSESAGYLQLTRALSGAQQAIEAVDRIAGSGR